MRTAPSMAMSFTSNLQLCVLLAVLTQSAIAAGGVTRHARADVQTCHARVYTLMSSGEHRATVEAAMQCLVELNAPNECPPTVCSPSSAIRYQPLSFMQGVALYRLGQLAASASAFAQALIANPHSRSGWQNLGDVLLYQFRLKEAVWAYTQGVVVYKVMDDVSKVCCRYPPDSMSPLR
jgi:hypothetical protein